MSNSTSIKTKNGPDVEHAGLMDILRRISHFVTRSSPSKNLEEWLFPWVQILCGCAALLAFVENALLKFNMVLQIGTLLAALLFALFWYLSWRGVSYTKLVYPATGTLVALLSVVWIFNAGSRGGTQLFLLICPLIFLVFASGVGRILTLGMYLIDVVLLMILEFTNPEIIVGYSSELERMADVSTSFFMALALAVIFTLVLHRGYRNAMAKADAEKRASDARFFETADMLPVGICEADRDLVISFFNRSGYELTGFTQGEFDREHTVLDLLHPDDRQQAKSDFSAILAGSHLPLHDFRIVRKDGKTLRVLLQCDQVHAEGKITGMRMCMIDVTEKKALEEQYRQSQKMESVGLLAGGVAHDFNNILSAVMGYASLIRLENREKGGAASDPKVEEQATAILNAGDRATDLVRKLLAFSRQGAYEVKPLNIHTLIDDVAALLSHSIDKRIVIAKNLTALNPVIQGDQSLLQSAFLNLAINARDAMPDGGTLTFSTACVSIDKVFAAKRPYTIVPGQYVSVSVSDTGTGMDANVKAHLFEPFFTTKEPGKGTGLGLASVFGTVKRHGGFIEAESTVAKGTAMTLWLPQAASPAPAEKAPAVSKKKGRLLHVMVVDDEPMICEFVKEFLSGEGHTTTSFTNPKKAVEWYRQNYGNVDCIVLDMNMPIMDGRACFSALRAVNPDARAIFSTGFMVGDTASIIRMPGIRGYIQKPFTLERLVAAVSQAVEGAPSKK
ncbi:MAG TPA: response regulator [Chitinivibrionales bacterium]|nr:response regulator [Chitinivibrionales bacterium]